MTLPYVKVAKVMGASEHARIPSYGSANAAGMDLFASEGGVLRGELFANFYV